MKHFSEELKKQHIIHWHTYPKYPKLKEVEKDIIKTKEKEGYSTKKSSIELEKLAFLITNMYEDNLKIDDLPKELQKYVQFYFKK